MNEKPVQLDWPNDPVVAEVRAIRARLWKEAGETVAGYFALVRRRAHRRKLAGRSKARRRSTRKRAGRTPTR